MDHLGEHLCTISRKSLREVLSTLDALSFRNYHLKYITDAQSFFKQARDVLPLDPPLSGKVKWEAFTDSLWSGLSDLNANRIAILWHDSTIMKQNDPINFSICTACLWDVCESLKTTAEGATKAKIIKILFIE